MSKSASFTRKVAYISAIALLLLPIAAISQPATINPGRSGHSAGGKLAQLRSQYNLAQAELGEIDPASETMKLSTLGLRGVAANILWGWANYYKKIEDWDKLEMTVNQIIRLQPNFVEVWDFQAHNLSYNVSVEFDDYRMRYQWVKKGIEFLILGSHYNRDEPGILRQIGWFVGQKIGRADEHMQFRRLFREDKDFHQTFRDNGIEVDDGQGPDGKPDNWLVSKLWYEKAVNAHIAHDKPIRGTTPLLFYSGAPMSIMNSAAAMNKDGYFFENAVIAWQQAKDAWLRYGERELPTSVGFNIRLNDQESVEQRIKEAKDEIARLCPGVEEEIKQEKINRLSADKKAVLQTAPAERSPEQFSLSYEAEQETKVLPRDFLSRAKRPEDRPRVRQLVDQIEEDEATSHQVEINRRIVNFAYWRMRAESELTDEAPKAHSDEYEANKLAESGEGLAKARGLYEAAWKLYAVILDKYPDLMDNAEAQDIIESVSHYRDVLGQLDEPFPADFPLWPLMDKHYKGQQIRDQVKLLQGRDAVEEKKPAEKKPEDKGDELKKSDEKPGNERPNDAKENAAAETKPDAK
ncbi:MAG TPA: hypothetical protein VGI40_00095 [Pirellulaceae bacterium]|jgi:hypothetical protein